MSRPRYFVYEFIVGGGGWTDGFSPAGHPLFPEAAAMLAGLTADVAATGRGDVVTLRDRRLGDCQVPAAIVVDVADKDAHEDRFARLAAECEATILIAPETGGVLLDLAQRVLAAGGRLLSPSPAFIAAATNKNLFAHRMNAAGVPVADGMAIDSGRPLPTDFRYPAVLKPADGAGSEATRVVTQAESMTDAHPAGWRMEVLADGAAASVAAIGGPAHRVTLPACSQRIERDERNGLHYRGGHGPLPPAEVERATRLANLVLETMPPLHGYCGVDILLGAAADGSDDIVLEVNPRLTTSYLGIRQIVRDNLASVLFELASGYPVTLSLAPGRVEFDTAHAARVERHRASLDRRSGI